MLGITRDLIIGDLKYYALAFILLLPLPLAGDYITHIAIMIMLYSITAASLDILVGYTGRLSLGHAAFYAIGAYTSTLLSMNLNVNPWIGIIIGGILASIFGLILGIPSLKLKGPYLAISTLGFGVIVQLMLINLDWLTNGPIGIPNIPPLPGGPIDLRIKSSFYYVALILTLLSIFFLHLLTKSRVGKILVAIREDEDAALSVGVNVSFFKIFAFIIATFFAGLSGGLYAHYIRYISPAMSALSESINILSMTIIGGFGTLVGPLMGAALLTILQEVLRPYLEYRYLIYGGLIVVVMKFFPSGIYGLLQSIIRKVRG
ncbi:branched-chain amino acid ABC transporter permease [Candidatus Korarchaeum cryptofilum]|uniref:ABC-type branched-chain amino acid transport system, permease component n=1 Tax=Korarchaeum cryptofilum (strain OPF8) TaxID=374847 RepID=B1L6C1_KORCO|nr:branched-chain amino acid ABC transporter permease [Candidatus Korarchaeum cryptofilum]ACB08000.1 ABC-type branched-chain amino acid transport system, permease component [Candidatus Korarchaeum cryptofilum OPF8]